MKTAPLKTAVCRNRHQSQERILKSALKEFAANGFAGARVDTIARRARINKRMLYHYFGNKEGLFREVLRRKIAERTESLASAPDDPLDSLSQWFRLACRDHEWVRLLEWEALQWGDRKVIDEEHRRDRALQAINRLRSWQAKGLFSPQFDPGQLLLSMIALTSYPLAFPQVARLITGLSVSGSTFQKQREVFLRQFAEACQAVAPAPAQECPPASPSNPNPAPK
jgi:AcrR family transcriptional regulator